MARFPRKREILNLLGILFIFGELTHSKFDHKCHVSGNRNYLEYYIITVIRIFPRKLFLDNYGYSNTDTAFPSMEHFLIIILIRRNHWQVAKDV